MTEGIAGFAYGVIVFSLLTLLLFYWIVLTARSERGSCLAWALFIPLCPLFLVLSNLVASQFFQFIPSLHDEVAEITWSLGFRDASISSSEAEGLFLNEGNLGLVLGAIPGVLIAYWGVIQPLTVRKWNQKARAQEAAAQPSRAASFRSIQASFERELTAQDRH
ncbi:hypothetical protein GO986_22360, partial [Deinococcus sp. HMF7620]